MTKSETNSNGGENPKKQFNGESLPEWHKSLLDSRRKAVEEGREKILDWDEIKDSLGKRQE